MIIVTFVTVPSRIDSSSEDKSAISHTVKGKFKIMMLHFNK